MRAIKVCMFIHGKWEFLAFQASIMSLLSSCRFMLTSLLQREKKTLTFNNWQQNEKQRFDSKKSKLLRVSCFLWVTDEDAWKMFGADAIFANVAKHICVFDESCGYFPSKFFSRLMHALKEFHKRNKINFCCK